MGGTNHFVIRLCVGGNALPPQKELNFSQILKIFLIIIIDSYFVGEKKTSEFLVELRKKDLTIYKPDKISKDDEFYEKYALGKILFTAKNAEIIGGSALPPLPPHAHLEN
jgi:hypothetical protein